MGAGGAVVCVDDDDGDDDGGDDKHHGEQHVFSNQGHSTGGGRDRSLQLFQGQTVPRQWQMGKSFLHADTDAGLSSPKGFTGDTFEMTTLTYHKKVKFHSKECHNTGQKDGYPK